MCTYKLRISVFNELYTWNYIENDVEMKPYFDLYIVGKDIPPNGKEAHNKLW